MRLSGQGGRWQGELRSSRQEKRSLEVGGNKHKKYRPRRPPVPKKGTIQQGLKGGGKGWKEAGEMCDRRL